MKRLIVVIGMLLLLGILPRKGSAQIPIEEVIQQGVKKVIKAVDLKVQRLQNKTVWLQNAQKVLENSMSEWHLDEITGWVQKQKDLYSDYYQGLAKVKSIITYYHQVNEIITQQAQLVAEYKQTWNHLQQDEHFSAPELSYMWQVYEGILDESVKNMDQLLMVVNAFVTQMTDAKRIEIINNVADKVNKNYSDLRQFNSQNAILSLQRAKDVHDAAVVRRMYGL